MRRAITFFILISIFCTAAKAEYTDHRGHNVDSLETVMAKWTAHDLAVAGDAELRNVADDLEELMYGFNQTNGVKSGYYARMLLGIARRKGWPSREQAAAKSIGQHFWAREEYDSAAFYYNLAMRAVERMYIEKKEDGSAYSQSEIDNGLSQMYGTIGNLYSMMDSIDIAMDYYVKAGELFKKHDWHNSCSVLYYNMGETVREKNRLREAKGYYQESMNYARLAQDSLAIATAYKGLGSTYLDMGKTAKAMRCLVEANRYFADHEDEELRYRMESLDYTSQVLEMQKKRLVFTVVLLVLLVLMAAATYVVLRRLRRTTKEKTELEEVLEVTVEEIGSSSAPARESMAITLKPKEREVLELIAKGYTNAQVADAMCLSPETIKWYKKKLFATFDVSNSAELISVARDRGAL